MFQKHLRLNTAIITFSRSSHNLDSRVAFLIILSFGRHRSSYVTTREQTNQNNQNHGDDDCCYCSVLQVANTRLLKIVFSHNLKK